MLIYLEEKSIHQLNGKTETLWYEPVNVKTKSSEKFCFEICLEGLAVNAFNKEASNFSPLVLRNYCPHRTFTALLKSSKKIEVKEKSCISC